MDLKIGAYEFKIKDTDGCAFITWRTVHEQLGDELYAQFLLWMRGQTCIQPGVYPDDVRRFVLRKPVVD